MSTSQTKSISGKFGAPRSYTILKISRGSKSPKTSKLDNFDFQRAFSENDRNLQNFDCRNDDLQNHAFKNLRSVGDPQPPLYNCFEIGFNDDYDESLPCFGTLGNSEKDVESEEFDDPGDIQPLYTPLLRPAIKIIEERKSFGASNLNKSLRCDFSKPYLKQIHTRLNYPIEEPEDQYILTQECIQDEEVIALNQSNLIESVQISSDSRYLEETIREKNPSYPILEISSSIVYIGEICIDPISKRQVPHGTGTLRTLMGEVIYEGGFKSGFFSGKGILFNILSKTICGDSPLIIEHCFIDKDYPSYHRDYVGCFASNWVSFDGFWENGHREGWGKIVFKNGREFTGGWNQQGAHGYGALVDGDMLITGVWKNNKLQRAF